MFYVGNLVGDLRDTATPVSLLGNMISNEGMRENSRLFLLMIKVNITNDEVIPLMGLLQVYIYYYKLVSNI